METLTKALVLAGLSLIAVAGFAQTSPPAAEARPVAPPDVSGPVVKAAESPGTNSASINLVHQVTNEISAVTNVAGAGDDLIPLIVIDDVPLLDAVKNLARQAGVNFQFDPRATAMTNQPSVTVRFENVTAPDALDAVLENYGLALKHDPKTRISRITLKDAKAEEPLVSQVIQLKYSSPSNMMTLLKSILKPPLSQVLSDPRTSQILVVATEKEMANVLEIIPKLDTPTKQVLIEAQLWETSQSPHSVKGVDWSGTLNAQQVTFGNGKTTGTITEHRNAQNSLTAPGTTATDAAGRPVQQSQSSQSSSLGSLDSLLNTAVGGGGLGLSTAKGFSPSTAFLNADGLSAVVGFLNTDNDTELVATPRAVTLDNQKASLSVIKMYPVYTVTPGSANSPAGSSISYSNAGVILNVTPRISANSNISLLVAPEASDLGDPDKQVINGQNYTANTYVVRRVETQVMIHSGYTLVMGGLMKDSTTKSYTKVPVLGDLPGVGLLFRQDKKGRDKSNLLIFVTPTIIEEGDLQLNPPSTFLKTEFKPLIPDKPVSAWDSGQPYDWTKLGNTNTHVPITPSKPGKL